MMQKKVFLIVSLCFLLTGLYAQEKKVGIMLERMVFQSYSEFHNFGNNDLEGYALKVYNDMKPRSESDYTESEKTYFKMVEKAFEKSFEGQNYKYASLVFENLSRGEIDKEDNLYKKVVDEYNNTFLNTKVWLINKKNRPKYVPNKTTGPLANIFADKLDSDLLLFANAQMLYFEKDATILEGLLFGVETTKTGNESSVVIITVYLVDGNTGRLVSYSAQSKYAKILFKEGKEEKTQTIIQKVVDKAVEDMLSFYMESKGE